MASTMSSGLSITLDQVHVFRRDRAFADQRVAEPVDQAAPVGLMDGMIGIWRLFAGLGSGSAPPSTRRACQLPGITTGAGELDEHVLAREEVAESPKMSW